METLDAIKTRRSIRKFKEGKISKEQIDIIMNAAMFAPSAGNAQTWEFIVIDDKEILKTIPDIHPFSNMTPTSQLGILVCADTLKEKHKAFWVQDCSAAIQNILLSVHDMGLGGVWLGIHPKDELVLLFSKKFGLPKNIQPLGFVSIGIPDMENEQVDRFDKKKIHWNKW